MNLVGARLAVFNEPSGTSVIQADTLKLFSGEDEVSARANYQSETVFTPTFKVVILCNTKPRLSEDTYAVWRRIKVVDWPILFKNDPDPACAREKPLDPLLDEKIKRWPPYFAGLMVHWLGLYRAEGLREPACVTQHTKKYEEEHDPWKEFRSTYLRRTSDNGNCGSTKLLNEFKRWYELTNQRKWGDQKDWSDKQLRSYFSKHLGEIKPNRIDGFESPTKSHKGWRLSPVE